MEGTKKSPSNMNLNNQRKGHIHTYSTIMCSLMVSITFHGSGQEIFLSYKHFVGIVLQVSKSYHSPGMPGMPGATWSSLKFIVPHFL